MTDTTIIERGAWVRDRVSGGIGRVGSYAGEHVYVIGVDRPWIKRTDIERTDAPPRTPKPDTAGCTRIPRTFFDDHKDRDLPTPAVVHQTKRHVWVRADDPHMPELLSDARYYDEMGRDGGFDSSVRGVVLAARALLTTMTEA